MNKPTRSNLIEWARLEMILIRLEAFYQGQHQAKDSTFISRVGSEGALAALADLRDQAVELLEASP